MGCVSSCSSRYASPNTVQLVHFNGYVEDFEHPISVSQVIGNPLNQFLCTAAQLLYAGSKQMNPDTQLQPGQLYFVVPFSTLKDDISPLDMASLVKRLKARVKSHDGSPKLGLSRTLSDRPKRRETIYGAQKSCRSVRIWKPFIKIKCDVSIDKGSSTGWYCSGLQRLDGLVIDGKNCIVSAPFIDVAETSAVHERNKHHSDSKRME